MARIWSLLLLLLLLCAGLIRTDLPALPQLSHSLSPPTEAYLISARRFRFQFPQRLPRGRRGVWSELNSEFAVGRRLISREASRNALKSIIRGRVWRWRRRRWHCCGCPHPCPHTVTIVFAVGVRTCSSGPPTVGLMNYFVCETQTAEGSLRDINYNKLKDFLGA